jgi:hypothetical protein
MANAVKIMNLDSLVITKTSFTGYASDKTIVGDVTPAGYSFHHAARCGGVVILLCDSLKCEPILRFQAKLFLKITN